MNAEQEELRAEAAGREDYLYEAYGAEARLLDAQAEDERLLSAGFFSLAGEEAAYREFKSRALAAESIYARHCPPVFDDVPF